MPMTLIDQTNWPNGNVQEKVEQDAKPEPANAPPDQQTMVTTTVTTHYTEKGVRESSVREKRHRKPASDPYARSNLAERIWDRYDEDGDALWRQEIERFDGTVNETGTSKTIQEYVNEPGPPEQHWLRYTFQYTWNDKHRVFVWDSTVEQDSSGKQVGSWHR